jgi:hypothetical protein
MFMASRFHMIGAIGLGLFAMPGLASASESLCAPTEQVFFNCQVKDSPKLLSVCGRAGDYLQYRFGSREKPELVFPDRREGSVDRFWVANHYVPSAFYDGYQLSFQSGGTEYRVYANDQAEGPDSPPRKYGGVIVSTAGRRDITMPCGSAPENALGVLVRKRGVEHMEGQSSPDDITRASFQLCQAMPFNSSDSDFKPGNSEYMLRPLDDAFMLGLHETPEVIDLVTGAAERLVAKPQHGKLARKQKTAGQAAAWSYTPVPGFVGNDRAEFVVRSRTKSGEAVEFRLIYKLRVTPEKLSAYIPQPDPPLLSVTDTYCSMSAILLDYGAGLQQFQE